MEANVMVQSRTNAVNPTTTRQPAAPSAPAQPAAAPERPQANVSGAPSIRLDLSNASIILSAPQRNDNAESVSFSDVEIPESRIAQYLREANRALEASTFRLSYDIHEATNTVMVQVLDFDTNEVLRELPPESRLDAIAKMLDLAGLLFDETS